MVALDAPAERRAEALAGMFLAGYVGLSLPVVALGVMTQYLSLRLSLLIFTAVLTAGVALVNPRLLIGDSGADLSQPARRPEHRLRGAVVAVTAAPSIPSLRPDPAMSTTTATIEPVPSANAQKLASPRSQKVTSLRHPLALTLLSLTFTTGVVDAVSYLGLGHVFTANMTGNVVLLGFGLAGAGHLPVLAPIVSLAAFLAGAAVAGRIATHMKRPDSPSLTLALALEIALVAAVAVAGSRCADRTGDDDRVRDDRVARAGYGASATRPYARSRFPTSRQPS